MHNLSMLRTSDLNPSARQTVESLLGRKLADGEELGIWASAPHEAPSGAERKESWGRLTRHLEVMALRATDVSARELEQLADQIADEVRHGHW